MGRLCVAVGVSDYGPGLDPLPGARRAAEKVFEWAKSAGYLSVLLTDDHKTPVTVDRLKGFLEPILETTELERMIFYFAGHGTIASAASEKWLLSKAVQEPDEAIDRTSFLRQLATFNVKQIALLIDACRSQSKMGLDVHGRGVVKNSGADRKNPQMDIFLAASLGDSAFHVKDLETGEYRCLFTETLLDGLYGRDARAIERDHPDAPAVVSGSLANFLEAELTLRAAQIDKKADPEIHPDFRRPNDVYMKLSKGHLPKLSLDARLSPSRGPLLGGPPSAPPVTRAGEAAMRETLQEIVPEMLKPTALGGDYVPLYMIGERTRQLGLGAVPLVTWSKIPSEIATSDPAPRFADDEMHTMAVRGAEGSANLFTKTEDGNWCFVPMYRDLLNVLTVGQSSLQAMTFTDLYDSYSLQVVYQEVLAPLVTGDLRAADADWLADRMRYLKHKNPVMGVIAAYLYAAKGDSDNIARMANYYFVESQPVPFDIALLCADRIEWQQDAELGFRVRADFPKVKPAPKNSSTERGQRPEFTQAPFEAKVNVPVAGFMPWMTQGWGLFERERGREIPGLLMEVKGAVTPGTFAALREEAGDLLIRGLGFHRLRVAEEAGGMEVA